MVKEIKLCNHAKPCCHDCLAVGMSHCSDPIHCDSVNWHTPEQQGIVMADMEERDRYYWDLLEELDLLDHPVSEWEASFLESVLGNPNRPLSDKQKNVIDRMKEKYLR